MKRPSSMCGGDWPIFYFHLPGDSPGLTSGGPLSLKKKQAEAHFALHPHHLSYALPPATRRQIEIGGDVAAGEPPPPLSAPKLAAAVRRDPRGPLAGSIPLHPRLPAHPHRARPPQQPRRPLAAGRRLLWVRLLAPGLRRPPCHRRPRRAEVPRFGSLIIHVPSRVSS